MSVKLDISFSVMISELFCILIVLCLNLKNFTLLDFLMVGSIFFIIIISYFKGTVFGLLSSIFIIFIYASYMLYGSLIESKNVTFLTYLWIIAIPFTSFVMGSFSKQINSLQKDNVRLSRELKNLVTIDQTTGLNNIKSFYIDVDKEISKSLRHKVPFTLMAVEIKYFDQIITILGERKLNLLTKEISDQLRLLTRNEDERYKLSENTFAVLMPNTDIKGCDIVKSRVKETLENLSFYVDNSNKRKLNLEFKIGAIEYSSNITNAFEFKELLEKELEYDV